MLHEILVLSLIKLEMQLSLYIPIQLPSQSLDFVLFFGGFCFSSGAISTSQTTKSN